MSNLDWGGLCACSHSLSPSLISILWDLTNNQRKKTSTNDLAQGKAMLVIGTSKIAYKDAHEPAIDDLGTKSAATIQASGSPSINSTCMRAVFFALAVTL